MIVLVAELVALEEGQAGIPGALAVIPGNTGILVVIEPGQIRQRAVPTEIAVIHVAERRLEQPSLTLSLSLN